MSTPFLPLLARPRNRGWGGTGEMWYQDANGIWVSIIRPVDWASVQYVLGLDTTTGLPAWVALPGLPIVRGAFIVSTTVLYPPSAAMVTTTVISGTIFSGSTLFVPTVITEFAVTGGTIASGSTLFSPTVVQPSNAKVAHGSFLTGTGAATTQVVVSGLVDAGDGLPFTPTVVIFWWVGNSSSGNLFTAQSVRQGFGVAVSSSNRRNSGGQTQHNPGTTSTDSEEGDESCIRVLSTVGALAGALDVVSLDSGGFTLVVDTQFTSDLRVHFVAYGGSDITNVATGVITEPAATGSQAVTGVGFMPDLLIIFGGSITAAPPTQKAGHTTNLGIGSRLSTAQCLSFQFDQDAFGTGTESQNYASFANILGRSAGASATVQGLASLTSYDADGFTLNWTTRTTTGVRYPFLAVKGGGWYLHKILTQTDLVTTSSVTGRPSQPKHALFFSGLNATEDIYTTYSKWSLGSAISISDRSALGWYSSSGTGNTAAAVFQRTDAIVFLPVSTATPAIRGIMDVQSFNPDGLTCIMDDADTVQSNVYVLTFG